MTLKNLYKITARPKLHNPVMIAAWPGVANVSSICLHYLRHKLDNKRLGEVIAYNFFDPIGITVKRSLVEAPQFPQSIFYYWKNPRGGSDIIFFQGDDQPTAKGYDLAQTVLDVAERFSVHTVYTFAAALSRIHHTEPSRVLAVVTTANIIQEMEEFPIHRASNLQIAGLNGLLMGVAKERKIRGVCLVGEVPQYAARIQNPKASLAILRVLAEILKIEIDFTDLEVLAAEVGEKMKQMAAQAMGEYIDFFTEPIWERDGGDDDDYDDEEDESESN
ncbi:PAC2 family protein [Chloroflexota bacterium]